MVKTLVAFVCAAASGAAVQLALSSCSIGDDGACQATPAYPAEQSPLAIVDAANYDASGNLAPLPFDLGSGTLAIEGQQLVVRYAVDGAMREVTYDIVPER